MSSFFKLSTSLKDTDVVSYNEDLAKELVKGHLICIEGETLPPCVRYAVNLRCGHNENSDIALHFSPNLSEKTVVRNSRLNNIWSEEEMLIPMRFSVEDFKLFSINILIAQSDFKISLNGRHICSFNFRTPLKDISNLQISGFVDIKHVSLKKVDYYPYPTPDEHFVLIPFWEGEVAVPPETQYIVPLTGILQRDLSRGWELNIKGRVKILPHSFLINLQKGRHVWPDPIIPLNLNVKFAAAGETVMTRNSYANGQWGREERAPVFHFLPGRNFVLVIKRHPGFYVILVDGNLAGSFALKGDPVVDSVYIQGDVSIMQIEMSKRDQEPLNLEHVNVKKFARLSVF